VVEDNVEAKHLEAGTAADVVWKARPIVVFEHGVGGYKSFYNNVINLSP